MTERCTVPSQFGELCRRSEECAIKRFARKWVDQTNSPESVIRNTERVLTEIENNPDCLLFEENFKHYQKLNKALRSDIQKQSGDS